MTDPNQVQISSVLQEKYDSFYLENREDAWRKLGAKYKVKNIVDVVAGQKFEKVLEVGAGEGSILEKLDSINFCNELHALEISKSGVESIKSKNIKSLKSVTLFDGYRFPFADNSFELAILSHVLEHVEFPRALLREIKRVSKFQVIEVPRDYKFNIDKRADHFLSYGHINVYTPSLLRFLLISEGFEINNDKMTLLTKDILRFQLNSKSFIKNLKLNIFFIIRNIAYAFVPIWRKETMINAYTVFLKSK